MYSRILNEEQEGGRDRGASRYKDKETMKEAANRDTGAGRDRKKMKKKDEKEVTEETEQEM